jgi:metal-responsive CopG/Arc/MetJ family transcriptional regulator
MMRTTLTIDDELMREITKETGKKAPLEAIREALQAYVQQQKLKKVLALRGTMDIEDYSQELRRLDTLPLDR